MKVLLEIAKYKKGFYKKLLGTDVLTKLDIQLPVLLAAVDASGVIWAMSQWFCEGHRERNITSSLDLHA